MASLPYKLKSKCESVLSIAYPGLSFEVEPSFPRVELRFMIGGSREDLIRHSIVTEQIFGRIPKCGVLQRVRGIWAIRKLSKGWRVEIVHWDSPLHERLTKQIREQVPHLDHIIARVQQMDAAHANAVSEFADAMLAVKSEQTRSVGRHQRSVSWKTAGNVIAPRWDQIRAQPAAG